MDHIVQDEAGSRPDGYNLSKISLACSEPFSAIAENGTVIGGLPCRRPVHSYLLGGHPRGNSQLKKCISEAAASVCVDGKRALSLAGKSPLLGHCRYYDGRLPCGGGATNDFGAGRGHRVAEFRSHTLRV
jgi:hypothetical protein